MNTAPLRRWKEPVRVHALELLFETAVIEADATVEVFTDRDGRIHMLPDCVPGMRPPTTSVTACRAGDLHRDLDRLCSCFDEPMRYPVSLEDANTLSCLLAADRTLTGTDPVSYVATLRALAAELASAARWTPHLGRWVTVEQAALVAQVAAVQDTHLFRAAAGRRLQPRERDGATASISDERAEADWVAALADQRWYLLTDPDWVAIDAGLFGLIGDCVPRNRCVTLPAQVAEKLCFAPVVSPFNVAASWSRADVEDAFRISGDVPAAVRATLAALEVARA